MYLDAVRQIINKYGYIIAGSVLLLIVLIYAFSGSGKPAFHPRLAYYVDEKTGEESVHSADEIPPLNNATGKPTLVQQMKFSRDGGRPFVAYLRKFDPEAQAKINEIIASSNERDRNEELKRWFVQGEMVRLPAAGSAWVLANSAEGEKVREVPPCKDGRPAVAVAP